MLVCAYILRTSYLPYLLTRSSHLFLACSHGRGIYRYANGDEYEGDFTEDQRVRKQSAAFSSCFVLLNLSGSMKYLARRVSHSLSSLQSFCFCSMEKEYFDLLLALHIVATSFMETLKATELSPLRKVNMRDHGFTEPMMALAHCNLKTVEVTLDDSEAVWRMAQAKKR